MSSNDLFDFMRTATKDMADEYQRIQKRAGEDPGTAGDQGEENWATLFRNWLPSYFHVVTKGRILSHNGTASPQVDVLVLSPSYPRHLLDKKLYLAGGVEAAFECKTTLKAEHVRKSLENAVEIRTHVPKRAGTPYKELHSPIVYGLLAHSHSWKSAGSEPVKTVEDRLLSEDRAHVGHPREMLDLVCVADLAAWTSTRITFLGPNQVGDPGEWETYKSALGEHGSASSAYLCHSSATHNQTEGFTPVGTLLTYLLGRLAWENPDMRKLSRYFDVANLRGSGGGQQRQWPATIYSDEVRPRVKAGYLSNGVEWDEWSVGFS